MKIDYVPLLGIQRELQGMPRTIERFQKYLQAIGAKGGNHILELPSLIAANPMGKEHVTILLDQLMAMEADQAGSEAARETAERLSDEPGEFKLGMVVADDLMGGWTNRYANEYSQRFPDVDATKATGELPRWLGHYWLTALLWSSEQPTLQAVREAVRTVIYRIVYIRRHGFATTLQEMMAQEGWVMLQAGCHGPRLQEEDLDYSREVLESFLHSADKRTIMECLFGDEAGKTLGFSPRGLSPWAGLAVALDDARRKSSNV